MIRRFFILLLILSANITFAKPGKPNLKLYKASNTNIQYFGRINFSDPLKPRFWSPGVYIKAKFKGTDCELVINDEILGGDSHNYIEIAIDNNPPVRIKLADKQNIIKAAQGLANTEHTITICKDTESGIGYLEF